MPIPMADLKGVVVTAIKGVSKFADFQDHVHPYRPLEPHTTSTQAASKLAALSAFVAIERIQKGEEDYDPVKRLQIVVDVWINPWSEWANVVDDSGNPIVNDDNEPIVIHQRDAEDLLVEVIDAIEALPTETWEAGDYKQRLAFQDAFRLVQDIPKPFLVYRILTQTETVIGNE